MNDILHKLTVLVLNRHWQAIHVKSPADAFCMLATAAATALDVQEGDYITPVLWNDWLKLPIRPCDHSVNTPRGPVRVPTVIVAARYAKVPLRRPRFGARGIWERDGGVCQYTGRKLTPKEGNIDHVVPRSVVAKPRGITACSRIAKSTRAKPTVSRTKPACSFASARLRRAHCLLQPSSGIPMA